MSHSKLESFRKSRGRRLRINKNILGLDSICVQEKLKRRHSGYLKNENHYVQFEEFKVHSKQSNEQNNKRVGTIDLANSLHIPNNLQSTEEDNEDEEFYGWNNSDNSMFKTSDLYNNLPENPSDKLKRAINHMKTSSLPNDLRVVTDSEEKQSNKNNYSSHLELKRSKLLRNPQEQQHDEAEEFYGWNNSENSMFQTSDLHNHLPEKPNTRRRSAINLKKTSSLLDGPLVDTDNEGKRSTKKNNPSHLELKTSKLLRNQPEHQHDEAKEFYGWNNSDNSVFKTSDLHNDLPNNRNTKRRRAVNHRKTSSLLDDSLFVIDNEEKQSNKKNDSCNLELKTSKLLRNQPEHQHDEAKESYGLNNSDNSVFKTSDLHNHLPEKPNTRRRRAINLKKTSSLLDGPLVDTDNEEKRSTKKNNPSHLELKTSKLLSNQPEHQHDDTEEFYGWNNSENSVFKTSDLHNNLPEPPNTIRKEEIHCKKTSSLQDDSPAIIYCEEKQSNKKNNFVHLELKSSKSVIKVINQPEHQHDEAEEFYGWNNSENSSFKTTDLHNNLPEKPNSKMRRAINHMETSSLPNGSSAVTDCEEKQSNKKNNSGHLELKSSKFLSSQQEHPNYEGDRRNNIRYPKLRKTNLRHKQLEQENKKRKGPITLEETLFVPHDLSSTFVNTEQKQLKKENEPGHFMLKNTESRSCQREHKTIKRKININSEESSIVTDSLPPTVKDRERKLSKKRKTENDDQVCKSCNCLISKTVKVDNLPKKAVYEYSAIHHKRLNIFSNEKSDKHECDQKLSFKLTNFSVYDKENHLSPIDCGLIEKNAYVQFAGYLKAVYEEDTSIQDSVPVKDVGPLCEWWVCGYDKEETLVVGISTDLAHYYLMTPSESYAPFMTTLYTKINLVKLIIEFLLEAMDKSYEHLLSHLQKAVLPDGVDQITEELLLEHAQFICEQVALFEYDTPDDDGDNLLQVPCIQTLGHYAGFNFNKLAIHKGGERRILRQRDPQWTKAVSTPLVQEVFESFFAEQLDDQSGKRKWSNKCGVCESCQRMDCGRCVNCQKMIKFGGNGLESCVCLSKKCKNSAEESSNVRKENDQIDEYHVEDAVIDYSALEKQINKSVTWEGEPTHTDEKRVFYRCAKVGEDIISIGDHVSVNPAKPTQPLVIGKISYMWQNSFKQKFMHVSWYCRSNETVLGETGDEFELFQTNDCENTLLGAIKSVVPVFYHPPPPTWSYDGGNPVPPPLFTGIPGRKFFYRFRYDSFYGRIEDAYDHLEEISQENVLRNCVECARRLKDQKLCMPSVDDKLVLPNSKQIMYGVVNWQGEEYRPGTCVLLQPTTFNHKQYHLIRTPEKKQFRVIDYELYTEYYRKAGTDHIKGSNESTPQPFCVGIIKEICSESDISEPGDIMLRVLKFYRPDNIVRISESYDQYDLNMLYSSNEEKTVSFLDVVGKCFIAFDDGKSDEASLWAQKGPNHFYFSQGYDMKNKVVTEPSEKVMKLLKCRSGVKDVTKNKKKKKTPPRKSLHMGNGVDGADLWPEPTSVLNCMDVFAGCGGLSEGLHQSGLSVTKWAIEKDEAPAKAFQQNYPSATVFNEDCNRFLKLALQGEKTIGGKEIPQKGEVDLLVGGPPCQGFSGVNRFNKREYSLFKNSLIVSFLSYCDYYRPKFFVFENVSKFVTFKNSMVLKLMLACLTKMGYQVTYGVLQAGSYGIPQSRRRAIIIAAAPGEILPKFPEPTHTFNLRSSNHAFLIDNKEFTTNCEFEDSAPYRTITVYDAISDLPPIENGANKQEIPLDDPPKTHFQKMMRGNQTTVNDHICKEMSPLALARITRIPTIKGSDWRDLPNITMKLSNGVTIRKLEYTHDDIRNGRSPSGALRGVCTCAEGKPCDPKCRQFNTLIPWSLPHTSNRQNNWVGVYGRLAWEGYFSTTMTNPEPMNKQGRVLHPTQNRVVSVRECARSQGFPDSFQLYGNILAKYRQVGNAVPPPLACALGREIIKSIISKDKKKNS